MSYCLTLVFPYLSHIVYCIFHPLFSISFIFIDSSQIKSIFYLSINGVLEYLCACLVTEFFFFFLHDDFFLRCLYTNTHPSACFFYSSNNTAYITFRPRYCFFRPRSTNRKYGPRSTAHFLLTTQDCISLHSENLAEKIKSP
jgi:hypothetical protein